MADFKVTKNNGMEIPDEAKCLWCGGTMERKGSTYLGVGTNSFCLFCDCGAIIHHAKNTNKKITGFQIKYELEEF